MPGPFKHILVATDFSPPSDAALTFGKELARTFDSRLSLLHVVTDPRATGVWTLEVYVPATTEMRDRLLQDAREHLWNALNAEEHARLNPSIEACIGAPADAISQFASEQNVDLIVMGTHGRRGIAHMLLGSVAERVVRTAPCPVLTTHAVSQNPETAAALTANAAR